MREMAHGVLNTKEGRIKLANPSCYTMAFADCTAPLHRSPSSGSISRHSPNHDLSEPSLTWSRVYSLRLTRLFSVQPPIGVMR